MVHKKIFEKYSTYCVQHDVRTMGPFTKRANYNVRTRDTTILYREYLHSIRIGRIFITHERTSKGDEYLAKKSGDLLRVFANSESAAHTIYAYTDTSAYVHFQKEDISFDSTRVSSLHKVMHYLKTARMTIARGCPPQRDRESRAKIFVSFSPFPPFYEIRQT